MTDYSKELKYTDQHQEPLLPFILSLTHRYLYLCKCALLVCRGKHCRWTTESCGRVSRQTLPVDDGITWKSQQANIAGGRRNHVEE